MIGGNLEIWPSDYILIVMPFLDPKGNTVREAIYYHWSLVEFLKGFNFSMHRI